MTVSISADKRESQVTIHFGSSVQEALKTAHITLGEKDRVEPTLDTVLTEGTLVRVIRVKVEFYTVQIVIPFEHQELRNEALPEGESRLSQAGVNGMEEVTYQRVFEDDIKVSDTQVKSVMIKKSVDEVVMIGSRSTFTPINIPGRIAYLSAGNAWILEGTTGNRRCVVCSGDLDGRIFSLSRNEEFLLFSRYSGNENTINSLWVATLKSDSAKLIDLGVENVVHFAEFDADSNVLAYSTAEWRDTAPGWQANNDLYELEVNADGLVSSPQLVIKPSSGSVYGWWGTEFSWSTDQSLLLFSRPDGIGIVDNHDGNVSALLNIQPYQTSGNWAWVPGAAWSPDGNVVYTVSHASSEVNNTLQSQRFDLLAIPLRGGMPIDLVSNVGMFSYPEPSPTNQKNILMNNTDRDIREQKAFSVAYLQALFPDQSETSSYRLFIMDRDGSNQKSLFPEEGDVGLDPQHVVWSPDKIGTKGDYAIAVIYNGNIWIIDVGTEVAQQITGDGLTNRIDWR
jgi:hypothetical protein